jgi:hypothetical protein
MAPHISEQEYMPRQLQGTELFEGTGADIAPTLADIWRWSASDLLSNAFRGMLAEFIVGSALRCLDGAVRREWHAYDFEANGIKVEVKSTALLQTWPQNDYSKPSFDIRKTTGWDAGTNEWLSGPPRRQADVHVFCLLTGDDKATVNPMNLSQWEFYVVATKILDELQDQQTITLTSLSARFKLAPISYADLADAVMNAANR